jgi:hypothetical protein
MRVLRSCLPMKQAPTGCTARAPTPLVETQKRLTGHAYLLRQGLSVSRRPADLRCISPVKKDLAGCNRSPISRQWSNVLL